MNIVIVGPGSLGCLLAATLFTGRGQNDLITLLDHNVQRATLVNEQGLRMDDGDTRSTLSLSVTASPETIPQPDVVLFCVKSYDLGKAIKENAPLLQSLPLSILMQNGIAHLQDEITSLLKYTAYGTTTEGATLLGPGHVRHAGKGITRLGFLGTSAPPLQDLLHGISERFTRGGMETETHDGILAMIWQKLVINCCINGLTVLHDCPNGQLLNDEKAVAEMGSLFAESMAVAAAKGIKLSLTLEDVMEVCRKTSANISSMLQDVRRGRLTEIDAINGALSREAERLHIAVPANKALTRQIHARQTLMDS